MQLPDTQRLARELMDRHGLADWTFRFDHARRRFGCCRVRQKLITLSRSLTLLNSDKQVLDTILHEIAHALTPGDGHGQKWKATCLQIGAKPIRCYNNVEVVAPFQKPARYLIGCRTCGWWADRRRLTARKLICRKCREPITYQDKVTGRQFQITIIQRRRILQPVSSM